MRGVSHVRGWGSYLPWLSLCWAWSDWACSLAGGVGRGAFWAGSFLALEEQRDVWTEQTVVASSADFTPPYGAYHLELLGAGLPGYATPTVVSRLYTPGGCPVGLGMRGS